jgi:5-methylcytosine-specific restriction enzyme subunit McrC
MSSPQTINLFEFVKYPWEISPDRNKLSDDLEKVLDKIWADRKRFIPLDSLYYKSSSNKQRFIDFRKNEIVPRNWIGAIHLRSNNDEYVFNLLPKIFYKEDHALTTKEIDSIFAHVIWWLSVSDKQDYSSMESSLGAIKSDFLEILVWIFSSYTLDVLSTTSYNYYETINEDIETVKGGIDFNKYAQNFARGEKQKLACVYDSFQYDNQFNRIVKYVSSVLKNFTKNPQTKRNLEEILFILDEVELSIVSVEDCDKVDLNPIYTEFRTILDNCRMFLSSLSVYKWKDDYNVFALLIPSEILFEKFIFSILKSIDRSINNVQDVMASKIGAFARIIHNNNQTGELKFKNDIVISFKNCLPIILDCKYKLINYLDKSATEFEQRYKVSQADVYQMASYAIRSKVYNIGLLFPISVEDDLLSDFDFHYEIDDEFVINPEQKTIKIKPYKVNIIHEDVLNINLNDSLENIFKNTKNNIINRLNVILIDLMHKFNSASNQD